MRSHTQTCEMCRKQFETQNNNAKYCSNQCRATAVNQQRREKYNPAPRRMLICVWCQAPFEAWTARCQACSTECAKLHHHKVNMARRRAMGIPERAKPKRERKPALPRFLPKACTIPLGELGTVTGRIVGRPADYFGELCVPVVLTHQLDKEPDWWPVGCVQIVEDEWV